MGGAARQNATRRARPAGCSGIGVSTYVEICALGPSKAMPAGGWEWGCVRIEISGKVTVITGVSPHGQGQETSFAQIAADRLGVPIEDIVVLHGDTATSRITAGTRTAAAATARRRVAIVMCIDKIIAKAKTLAAHLLETTAEEVEFEDGTFFVTGVTRTRVGWAELASEAYIAKNLPPGFEPGLEASSFFEPQNFTFPFGTHIVAVEMDRDTGQVDDHEIHRGRRLRPPDQPAAGRGPGAGRHRAVDRQALFEQTVYDENGQLLTGEFMDYAIPRAADIPEYVLGSTVTPSPSNPLGVKGVGEAGTIGATPAIANAVIDALSPLGIRHLDLPFTPERVWRAIQARPRRDGDGAEEMIPAAFDYVRPATLDEALALLAQARRRCESARGRPQPDPGDEAAALASPKIVVDIARIATSDTIRERDGKIAIGALTTHYDIESSDLLRRSCPLLPEVAAKIGDVQVRNKGTIGGSLRPRGSRGRLACGDARPRRRDRDLRPEADAALGCKGFLRGHADPAVEPGEILKAIRVPVTSKTVAYVKFAQKASGFAIAGVAVVLDKARKGCRHRGDGCGGEGVSRSQRGIVASWTGAFGGNDRDGGPEGCGRGRSAFGHPRFGGVPGASRRVQAKRALELAASRE